MASIQQKGKGWYCRFLYHGKRHTFTVGAVTQDEAEAKASHVDYLLMRLKQRLATIPPGVDIVDYVQFDGKPEQLVPEVQKITLADLQTRYLSTHESSLELSTVKGIKQHFGHLTRHLGEKFPIAELSLSDLQGYVDKRAKAKGRNGRKLSPATIKKELVSLRTCWNWAVKMKLVSGKFPNDGLRFPKATEKPSFMTFDEITRRIESGKLSEAEQADLWASLYLTVPETAELLAFVKTKAIQPWVYPIMVFCAHTGARRSEALRTKISDVDFKEKTVTIHEKKRVKETLTTRRVPLSGFLTTTLGDWLKIHPGGEHLFCQGKVIRSKTRKGIASPITNDEAADHFTRSLEGSKWGGKARGYHVWRHSWISSLANSGCDQRIIAEMSGHMSEEQQRRYRHIYSNSKSDAIAKVFG